MRDETTQERRSRTRALLEKQAIWGSVTDSMVDSFIQIMDSLHQVAEVSPPVKSQDERFMEWVSGATYPTKPTEEEKPMRKFTAQDFKDALESFRHRHPDINALEAIGLSRTQHSALLDDTEQRRLVPYCGRLCQT